MGRGGLHNNNAFSVGGGRGAVSEYTETKSLPWAVLIWVVIAGAPPGKNGTQLRGGTANGFGRRQKESMKTV